MGADTGVPAWVENSFPTIRIIIAIIVAVLAIALVAIVLIQPSASNGNSVITGQSDTFYGKNKSQTLEGLLRKITVIIAISIAVLIVIYFITVIVYTGYAPAEPVV